MYYLVWHDSDGVHVKEYKDSETLLGVFTELTKKDVKIDLVCEGKRLKLEPVERPPEFRIQ